MRNDFAQFLERLAAGNEFPSDWNHFAVGHHADDLVESIRRQLVRLAIERDPLGLPVWLDVDREQFLKWVVQLRAETT